MQALNSSIESYSINLNTGAQKRNLSNKLKNQTLHLRAKSYEKSPFVNYSVTVVFGTVAATVCRRHNHKPNTIGGIRRSGDVPKYLETMQKIRNGLYRIFNNPSETGKFLKDLRIRF